MRNATGRLVIACAVLVAPAMLEAQTGAPVVRMTFEEAIRMALEKNPGVAEAAQAILQAEALLQQARTVYRPTLDGAVVTTVLDNERGFDGQAVQPQMQTLLAASLSYPVLASSRWAARASSRDSMRTRREASNLVEVSPKTAPYSGPSMPSTNCEGSASVAS